MTIAHRGLKEVMAQANVVVPTSTETVFFKFDSLFVCSFPTALLRGNCRHLALSALHLMDVIAKEMHGLTDNSSFIMFRSVWCYPTLPLHQQTVSQL